MKIEFFMIFFYKHTKKGVKFDTLGIFNYFSPGTYTRKVNNISNERKKIKLLYNQEPFLSLQVVPTFTFS